MSMYSLTQLTGRKRNADRKIIVATIETNKHGFIVSVVALALSSIPTFLAVTIFGSAAMVIVPPLCVAAGLVLFKMRSDKGLKLPMYRMLLDRGAAKKLRGQLLICGVPVQRHARMSKAVHTSVPVESQTSVTRPAATPAPSIQPAFGNAASPSDTSSTERRSDLWD